MEFDAFAAYADISTGTVRTININVRIRIVNMMGKNILRK